MPSRAWLFRYWPFKTIRSWGLSLSMLWPWENTCDPEIQSVWQAAADTYSHMNSWLNASQNLKCSNEILSLMKHCNLKIASNCIWAEVLCSSKGNTRALWKQCWLSCDSVGGKCHAGSCRWWRRSSSLADKLCKANSLYDVIMVKAKQFWSIWSLVSTFIGCHDICHVLHLQLRNCRFSHETWLGIQECKIETALETTGHKFCICSDVLAEAAEISWEEWRREGKGVWLQVMPNLQIDY